MSQYLARKARHIKKTKGILCEPDIKKSKSLNEEIRGRVAKQNINAPEEIVQASKYSPGKYVACKYDQDWYIGMITERSDRNNDVFVKFMKRAKVSNSLSWPKCSGHEC